jgi:hypothetical protein
MNKAWLTIILLVPIFHSCTKKPDEHSGPEQFYQIDLYFPEPYVTSVVSFNLSESERHFSTEYPVVLPADSFFDVYLGHWDVFRNLIPIGYADENHQVFWIDSGCDVHFEDWLSGIAINEYPGGVLGKLYTNEPCTGTLTLVCLHKPDKGAIGVADGDTTNAGGELDYIVKFDLIVE